MTRAACTDKRILSIEARLGGRLFERGQFGVRPTAFGQALYPSAKQALGALHAVAQAAEEARQAGFSDLRLSASVTIGEFLLPAWLSAFRRIRPDVRPQLEITNSTEVLAAVREHRCDIGFVEGLDPLEGLEALPLAHDEIVAVIATSHPWARRRVLSPRELLNEPYLTREAASGTRAVATAALATVGIELQPVLQAASAQSLKRSLEDGGFTLISRITIEAEQRAGTLTGIPIVGLDLTRGARRSAAAGPPRPGQPAPSGTGWPTSLPRRWRPIQTTAVGDRAKLKSCPDVIVRACSPVTSRASRVSPTPTGSLQLAKRCYSGCWDL